MTHDFCVIAQGTPQLQAVPALFSAPQAGANELWLIPWPT